MQLPNINIFQGRRIVIHAQRFRTQERNPADAIGRLVELLRQADATSRH
jgi:hypothetical protein